MTLLTSQFVGSGGWQSALIKIKGGGPFSHVDLVLPDGSLLGARSDKIMSIPSGVQVRPPDYERWERVERISVEVTPEQYSKAMGFAFDQVGKPYDYISIFGFLVNRNWRDEDAWFCSELQIAIIERADVFKFPLMVKANKIDPDFAYGLTSIHGKVTVIK